MPVTRGRQSKTSCRGQAKLCPQQLVEAHRRIIGANQFLQQTGLSKRARALCCAAFDSIRRAVVLALSPVPLPVLQVHLGQLGVIPQDDHVLAVAMRGRVGVVE